MARAQSHHLPIDLPAFDPPLLGLGIFPNRQGQVVVSRLASIPLTILLIVAYLTADIAVVKNILGDPDKFLAADEFLFLFVVLLVLLFGPGKFSIDWLFNRKVKTET